MIVAETKTPTNEDFKELMSKTDNYLNKLALEEPSLFKEHGGLKLEGDILSALNDCSKGTLFENTIHLVSGSKFPDLIVGGNFGVEVKSTNKNHWTSIGSSILESTRLGCVDRIYLMFGKLGDPIQFLSRPYESCLSEIAVTHYPRYLIDMKTQSGESIFDKMKIDYDQFRQLEDPITPLSNYYKGHLKAGQSLWWAGKNEEDNVVNPTIRLWSSLEKDEKEKYTILSYVIFPEILASRSNSKYQRLALWLVTKHGIVNTNIRDQFSAGGTKTINGFQNMPAAFGRIFDYKNDFINALIKTPSSELEEYWHCSNPKDRIEQWINLAIQPIDDTKQKIVAKQFLEMVLIN